MDRIKPNEKADVSGVSPFVLALRSELARGAMERVAAFMLGGYEVEVASASDSVWALLRRPGRGVVAMRLAYAPGDGLRCRKCPTAADEELRFVVTSVLGEHEISL
ncbi:MAG TPA: hypothetical protein VFL92_11080, partial [Sphingomonas sp.]|nr:hypothetical protein [Sphingomonas sp.]